MRKKNLAVHFVGMGGSGASAVAAIAEANGFKVTGCDRQRGSKFITTNLKKRFSLGHSVNHINGLDVLAVSPAVFSAVEARDELVAAKKKE